MFNRRFLRVKVFQSIYAFRQDENASRVTYEKNLVKSLDKSYELYLYLISFSLEYKFFAEKELEAQQSRHYPNAETISLLKSFINNKVIAQFERTESLKIKLRDHKVKFNNSSDTLRKVFLETKDMETFVQYSNLVNPSVEDDKNALLALYEELIADSEFFNFFLEENFANWEDDMVMVTQALQRTIIGHKNGGADFQSSFYKDKEEDLRFAKDLFYKTIEQDEEFTVLISAKAQNWESDRIAMIDLLLMKMALCELMYFSQIPVKVTINEYLELAKLYSTPQSHGFINGLLDKIQIDLQKSGRVAKAGRGLVE